MRDHIAALLRPRPQMLLITLEYPQEQMPGPPFSVPRDEVERLYSRQFPDPGARPAGHPGERGAAASRGLTALYEVCYQLVRQ